MCIRDRGNTVRFRESFSDFPSSAWTCALKLNRPGINPISIAGSVDGTGFAFLIPATTTAAMEPGQYSAAFYVTQTSSGERTTAKTASVTVTPNLGGVIDKSTAAQMLDAVNTAILALASGTNQTVSFNNQSFTKKNLKELMAIRDQLQAEVINEERIAAGRTSNIQIRFTPR
jgi:hypothetical protein